MAEARGICRVPSVDREISARRPIAGANSGTDAQRAPESGRWALIPRAPASHSPSSPTQAATCHLNAEACDHLSVPEVQHQPHNQPAQPHASSPYPSFTLSSRPTPRNACNILPRLKASGPLPPRPPLPRNGGLRRPRLRHRRRHGPRRRPRHARRPQRAPAPHRAIPAAALPVGAGDRREGERAQVSRRRREDRRKGHYSRAFLISYAMSSV